MKSYISLLPQPSTTLCPIDVEPNGLLAHFAAPLSAWLVVTSINLFGLLIYHGQRKFILPYGMLPLL